jgi:hypothetical protein
VIAAIIGWFVKLEKKIPNAVKLAINKMNPKELPIRYPKSISAHMLSVESMAKM